MSDEVAAYESKMTKTVDNVSAFAAYNSSSDVLKLKPNKISKKQLMKSKKLNKSEVTKFEEEYTKVSSLLSKNKKMMQNKAKNEAQLNKKSPGKAKQKKATPSKIMKSAKTTDDTDILSPCPKVDNHGSSEKNMSPVVQAQSDGQSKKRHFDHNKELKVSPMSKKKNKDMVQSNNQSTQERVAPSPSTISVRKAPKLNIKKNDDSRCLGDETLSWMIHPHSVNDFFKNTFEEKPLYIPRKENRNYYKDILSTKTFDEMLRSQRVYFGKNLDVTTFVNDKRENHAPEGRAYPSIVWDFYNNGCSLRLLNPQTFNEKVWKLCATLQECMGSMVGANMYLTPPGTQGFAPHYDDVEVFILQLEGKKHWRVYDPPTKLPRFSSPNFSQSEMKEPIMDIVLEAGDLLYMPRGTIHQGNCLEDAHSLHITISCHQQNSYGDLLGKILSEALETAMEEDEDFRKGLPRDYFNYVGAVHSDRDTPGRSKFMATMKKLMGKLHQYAPIDDGCDKMAQEFLHSTLPPVLTANESKRTVESGGERWNSGKNHVVNRVEFDPDTEIRLLRANCLRIVKEEDSLRLYYNVENSREYKELDAQYLEVEEDFAEAIEHLIVSYPSYVKVEDLPLDDIAHKFTLVQNMWERKLILTKEPLESHYDD